MKKIFLTMVAILSMTVVMAQDNDKERKAPKQMTPEEMTTRMTKELSLTADQKSKVQSLNKEYKDYLGGPGMGGPRGPRPDGNAKKSGNNKQQRPQMTEAQQKQMEQHKAKRQEYDKKLKSILSADQYKTYQQQNKRRGPGEGKRPERNQE